MTQDRLHNLWLELDAQPQRQAALGRAADHSELTIPRLFAGYESIPSLQGQGFMELYSDTMATLITTRAGKLTDAVFPPNGVPFFQFEVDTGRAAQMVEEGKLSIQIPEGVQDVDGYFRDMLAEVENYLHRKLQASNYRDILNVGFQHAQVTGDPVLHMDDDYNFRLYHLGQILLRRDMHGRVSEYMLQMWVKTDLLPDDLKVYNDGRKKHDNGEYEPYYRHMYRKDGKWYVDSEFRGIAHGDTAEYSVFPYFHIGWNNVAGEDYSRTPVEDHFGAITSLEMCHKALAEGAAGSAEWRLRMDPFSQARPSDVEDTENGQVILARQGELEALTIDLRAPLQAIAAYVEQLEARLERAWGISAASTLRGERVTATQIQQATQEVAEADGPILTHVASSLQESVVRRMVEVESKKGNLHDTFKELWKQKIITIGVKTGLDALGRQIDAARIQSVLGMIAQFPDPAFVGEINTAELAKEFIRVSGLDPSRFTYSEEEKAQRQAAAQQAALAQKAGEQVVESTGRIAEQAAQQQ
jgi:hypothetical protein